MSFIERVKRFIYQTTGKKNETTYVTILGFIKIKLTNKRREGIIGYLFIMPWLIGFLWLTLYPIIMSLVYSFANVTIPGGQGVKIDLIGFGNYEQIFSDVIFTQSVQNFVLELLIYLPLSLIVSMILAMMLNQKIKFKGTFRVIFFLPVIIASGPIITTLFGSGDRLGILSGSLNNDVPNMLGGFLPPFLADFVGNMYSHLINILWFSGVQIILFLAALQKINQEVYEAASIDGASPWESFWKITLPSLKSIILVCAIYTIVMLSTISTNGVLYRINVVRQQSFGMSSALAWAYFLVVALILMIVCFVLIYEKKPKIKKMNYEVRKR